MTKYLLFLVLLIVILGGCGRKSTIKNDIAPRTTAETYGDGTYTVVPFVVPLSNQAISSFDSPISKIHFIMRGFAKMFMDLGAGMGFGKIQLSLIQPIPEIPSEYIKEARIKRLFFYIEPKKGIRDQSFWKRLLDGKDDVNFKFLDKMALELSSYPIENVKSWMPTVETKSLSSKDFSPLQSLFDDKNQTYGEIIEAETMRKMLLLKYDKEDRDLYLRNGDNGIMYVISTDQAAKTRRFLQDHPKFKNYFKSIHILDHSLLVELVKDPVVEESFKVILSEDANDIAKMGVKLIEECSNLTCLELSVPDVNLIPLMMKGNGIKLDAFIDADKVPESFQLKGFVEFEIKLKLSF